MSVLGTLVTNYLLPVAVLVSAGSATATATFAYKLWTLQKIHDRALFGEEAVDGHDGVVAAVNENTERSEVNRRVLRAHDLVPRQRDDFYRGDSDRGDEQAAK